MDRTSPVETDSVAALTWALRGPWESRQKEGSQRKRHRRSAERGRLTAVWWSRVSMAERHQSNFTTKYRGWDSEWKLEYCGLRGVGGEEVAWQVKMTLKLG